MSSNESQAITKYRQTCRRGLSPRHREAMRRLASGQSIAQVADQLGYSNKHLSTIAASPLFKREMERMLNRMDQAAYNALAELRRIQPKAVKTYSDLMTQDEFQTLRFTVAKDLLDRTGVGVGKMIHTLEQTESYEQRLAKVRQKMTVESTHSTDSPIEIMGGQELLEEYDNEVGKKRG